MNRVVSSSVVACGIWAVIATAAPAAAATPQLSRTVATRGAPVTDYHDVLGGWADEPLDDALVVVVPGTDDTVYPRVDGIVGPRESLLVTHPESFGPIISGRSGAPLPILAPSYDSSRAVATANTLAVMKAFRGTDRVVVYTGYSQGSDALGDAAERAARRGWLNGHDEVLLVSDPRGPWGVKSLLSRTPFAGQAMAAFGVDDDGARDPAATGDVKVVQVIVRGDPIADPQWDPNRPVESAVVNAAGFVTIHAGHDEHGYAHVENLDHVSTMKSTDGDTTYEVYDTDHPLALAGAKIADAVGVHVGERELKAWDRAAEAFYPMQDPTAATADPKAKVVDAPRRRP
ncbi:PE-PPE domain-containing protein [Gordonia neofelifaecis]|uniref:PE-PPE domain-containing protein n=1 Tax=Gordonia neofelifaecis NRRL B-59395 TaxID=644548 RepID=F1YIN7_9ACTN|nr:PE-PPE domain-containing protein [Gordonia neofelifaecis]EGD55345.1 hypothetical protein SCNU_08806 [Gordonia neofelifaecis NRRL B-59395]